MIIIIVELKYRSVRHDVRYIPNSSSLLVAVFPRRFVTLKSFCGGRKAEELRRRH